MMFFVDSCSPCFHYLTNSLPSIPCFGPSNKGGGGVGVASSPSVSKTNPPTSSSSSGRALLFFCLCLRWSRWLSGSSSEEPRTSQPFRRCCLHFAWKTPPSHTPTKSLVLRLGKEKRPWANERHHNTFVFLGTQADGCWWCALADAVDAVCDVASAAALAHSASRGQWRRSEWRHAEWSQVMSSIELSTGGSENKNKPNHFECVVHKAVNWRCAHELPRDLVNILEVNGSK